MHICAKSWGLLESIYKKREKRTFELILITSRVIIVKINSTEVLKVVKKYATLAESIYTYNKVVKLTSNWSLLVSSFEIACFKTSRMTRPRYCLSLQCLFKSFSFYHYYIPFFIILLFLLTLLFSFSLCPSQRTRRTSTWRRRTTCTCRGCRNRIRPSTRPGLRRSPRRSPSFTRCRWRACWRRGVPEVGLERRRTRRRRRTGRWPFVRSCTPPSS